MKEPETVLPAGIVGPLQSVRLPLLSQLTPAGDETAADATLDELKTKSQPRELPPIVASQLKLNAVP